MLQRLQKAMRHRSQRDEFDPMNMPNEQQSKIRWWLWRHHYLRAKRLEIEARRAAQGTHNVEQNAS